MNFLWFCWLAFLWIALIKMLDLHIEYPYVLDNLEVIKNPERISPKTEPHKGKTSHQHK
jgi:hypothetical protein